MKNSKIEWCDHTFNPWMGCTKVSPGCDNCYAEAMMDLRLHKVRWGKGQPRLANKALANHGRYSLAPWAWNLQAKQAKIRHRVFCGSLCDWLDPEAPVELLARLLVLIERTPSLDWLLLTKRPELWCERMVAVASYFAEQGGWVETGARLVDWISGVRTPRNIWIGTTVENQAMADKRIPRLLEIPAKVRFLSCEPQLGHLSLYPLSLSDCDRCGGDGCDPECWHPDRHPIQMDPDPCQKCALLAEGIHWVICGGESGPNARPMHPDWARSLRDQCAAADVPFFFKQWGEWAPGDPEHIAECSITTADHTVAVWPDGRVMKMDSHSDEWFRHCRENAGGARLDEWGVDCMHRVGKRRAGRSLDRHEHNEFPTPEQIDAQ